MLLFTDDSPDYPRGLMAVGYETNVTFMPANTVYNLKPMDQELMLAF